MKGTIALDIDGTITVEHHALPQPVVSYLTDLANQGWNLIFITGRTFAWGYAVLKFLPIPYYLAVQNGAIIIEMPSRRIISKKYLDRSIFPEMNAICQREATDFVIYTGFERQDECYYRPKQFSQELLNYLKSRINALEEKWIAVDTFENLEVTDFPSVKCFGLAASAMRLTHAIEKELGLHVPIIRDPFNENYYVVQATDPRVDKGQALKDLISYTQNEGIIIAAGDDNNDQPMLAAADIKVVMETAPLHILEQADIIAPSAKNFGIIQGLQEAILKSGK